MHRVKHNLSSKADGSAETLGLCNLKRKSETKRESHRLSNMNRKEKAAARDSSCNIFVCHISFVFVCQTFSCDNYRIKWLLPRWSVLLPVAKKVSDYVGAAQKVPSSQCPCQLLCVSLCLWNSKVCCHPQQQEKLTSQVALWLLAGCSCLQLTSPCSFCSHSQEFALKGAE